MEHTPVDNSIPLETPADFNPPEDSAVARYRFHSQTYFSILWANLPVIAIVLLYLPYAHGDARLWLVGFPVVLLALSCLVHFWKPKEILMFDEGFRFGKKFTRWQEITKIQKSWIRVSPIEVILGRRPRQGIELIFHRSARTFRIRPISFVLGKLLPAIIANNPDVEISKRARRAMENPKRIILPPRLRSLLVCIPAGILAMLPFAARHWEPMNVVILSLAATGMLVYCLFALASLDVQQRFAMFLVTGSTGLIPMAINSHLFLDAPLYAFDSLVILFVAMVLASGVVTGFRLKFSPLQKVIILLCVILPTLFVYARGKSNEWAITELDFDDEVSLFMGPYIWADDGSLAAELFLIDHPQSVLDLHSLETITLPIHEGTAFTAWLDRSRIIRVVNTDEEHQLFEYDFQTSEEHHFATAPKISIEPGKSLQPGGKLLCWLEGDDYRNYRTLRIYDLDSRQVETHHLDLLKDANIEWRKSLWTDEQTLTIWGLTTPDANDVNVPQALHVLRLDPQGNRLGYLVTSQKYNRWRLSPGCRYAFASGNNVAGDEQLHFFNLNSGKERAVRWSDYTYWDNDDRFAFRLVGSTHDEGVQLMRFDPASMREDLVIDIPTDVEVESVSPNGRLAIVTLRGGKVVAPLGMLNTRTGQIHRLPVSITSAMLNSLFWSGSHFQTASFWPKDGSLFLLHSTSRISKDMGNNTQIRLFHVPQDWLKD